MKNKPQDWLVVSGNNLIVSLKTTFYSYYLKNYFITKTAACQKVYVNSIFFFGQFEDNFLTFSHRAFQKVMLK